MATYGNFLDLLFPTEDTSKAIPPGQTVPSTNISVGTSQAPGESLSCPLIWDKKQVFIHGHDLDQAKFCMKYPEYAAGNLEGHIAPGLFFCFWYLYYMWVIFSRYFKSIAPGSTYKFYGPVGRLASPWNPEKPLAFYYLMVLVPFIILSSLVHRHADEVYIESKLGRMVDYYTTDPHFSMLCLFVVAMLFDNLEPKRRFSIPKMTSCLFFAMAVFALTGALLFHGLSPKCAYSGKVHLVFIFFPSLVAFVSKVAQFANPSSFFLAINTAFWASFIGLGYMATGVLCFPVKSGHRFLDPDHPSVKMGKVPAQFILTFTFFSLIVTAWFLVFGTFRGRPLGSKNPDYYIHDEEYEQDEVEFRLKSIIQEKATLMTLNKEQQEESYSPLLGSSTH